MLTYINYGSNAFDSNKFSTVTNHEMFNKPDGGLWASPVDSKYGWKNFCENQNFRCETLNKHFEFTLTPEAKIYVIASDIDVQNLPTTATGELLNMLTITGLTPIDFEKIIHDGYDAIYFDMDSYPDGYNTMRGWDCTSLLVLNPNVVQQI